MSSYSIISYPAEALPKAYQNMIYSKWLRSLRYSNDFFKLIDGDSYFSSYQKYIGLILSRPSTLVRLAVLTDDHDVVLGWAVVEGAILHYVHVHKDHRKQGIATSLVPKGVEVITHITRPGLSIWANKMPGVILNPFA
jgi:GNAT superfamily N-acetyltransferase